MILSDKDISRLIDAGELQIDPYDVGSLKGASYDVCLDNEVTFLVERSGVVDISRQMDLDQLYGPQLAIDDVVLKPGQYCLAALEQRIKLPDNVAAEIVPRTRYTRMGLLVQTTFCNPSYSGRLRVGLLNASGNNIRLRKHIGIAQLVFHSMNSVPSAQRLYRNQKNATYQDEDNFMGARAEKDAMSPEAEELYAQMMNDLRGGSDE